MSAGPAARVLVADADPATRAGVNAALVRGGFEVCAEAESAQSALDAARREQPDACLVDADLAGGGIAAARDLDDAAPGTVIVMLGTTADDEHVLAAIRAGARGFLPKDMDPDRLVPALRAVLDGEPALPRALMGRVLDELHGRRRYRSELARLGVDLTRREQEVLELLDQGMNTADMARALDISAVTVRRHLSGLLRKLDAPDRDAALRRLRPRA